MRAVQDQAAALAGALAAATGSEPRTEETDRGIRVEADLPDPISPTAQTEVLTALASADRYGHARTDESATVWAEIDREAEQ
ncbi:hypothetical protein ACFYW6_06935 [Streptomyces sp. NPDC002659]|uniref:hypothetical protein n=1 Tax=Streptomyces sp. NPDC002659 TaxID=3364656 RepID=UPI0036B236AC